jgi:hypothetical protein
MPRSATTGVFTRVSNSFSNPVFGTLIDPTDADAYFDDLDVGLNPPELDGPVRIIDALQVGTAGTAAGTSEFFNATSGSITILPPTGALGARTLTLPGASGTVMTLENIETVTGAKTFGAAGNVGKLIVAGNTSGVTILNASAVASGTLTLPAATDTLVARNTTDTLANKTLTAPILGVATATSLSINGAAIGSNGIAVNGSSNFAGAMIVQSASASAFTAGASGALNPALQVDASAGSAATGIKITAFAAAGGSAITTISSGTNENLAINAKGSGTIAIANTSTGGVLIGQALTYGGVTLANAVTGTGNMVLGTSPAITTPNIVGTTTANNAAAGSVGEYIESNIPSGTPVAAGATGISKNLTSITLSAGDWDVTGVIAWVPANTTTLTGYSASISLTTNTADVTFGRISQVTLPSAVTGVGNTTSTNVVMTSRFNVSSSTTVFLVGTAVYGVSTVNMYGNLRARRVR